MACASGNPATVGRVSAAERLFGRGDSVAVRDCRGPNSTRARRTRTGTSRRVAWDIPAWSVEELRAWLDRQGISADDFRHARSIARGVGDMPWLRDL
jgi:hypothetical protein